MARPIVIVTNKIHDLGMQRLHETVDAQYLDYKLTAPDAFMAGLRSCDGIVLRGAVKLSDEVLQSCPKLKVIGKHGAGVEGVDMEAATRLGIIVANSGGANASAVAEGTITLILSTYRRMQAMREIVTSPNYHVERNRLVSPDLRGKTIGLVGFGNIGRLVSKICRGGFDNEILVLDPAVSAAEAAEHGATKVESLEALLPQVDVLSIHVPLMKSTRNLIAMPQLRLMRPNAILVNTARGGIVDERDLAEAISTGVIWGAGIDVFENEPPEPDNPLLALRNVVVTPHCAGGSESAGVNAATESVGAVLDVLLAGKAPRYVLNRDVLGHSRAALSAA
jgi:D-3-phosphoglycerate dehydrogenase